MRGSRFICLAGGLLLVTACSKQPPEQAQPQPQPLPMGTADKALPEITSESEEGFADLVFRLQAHEVRPDGAQKVRVAGLHKNQPFGFDLVLGPTWKKGKYADIGLKTNSGTVSYRSVGAESDAFLQVLDELYGTKLSPKAM